MIGHLRGTAIGPDLVDVGGVGYLVTPTFPLVVGEPVSMVVHTVVREDALDLFGFASTSERDLFLTLIRVPKVGPKVAVSILSGLGCATAARAIAAGDHAALAKVRGVGPRLAQGICSSVTVPAHVLADLVGDDAPATSTVDGRVEALVGLGYSPAAAQGVIDAVLAEHGTDLPDDRVLRLALLRMSAA